MRIPSRMPSLVPRRKHKWTQNTNATLTHFTILVSCVFAEPIAKAHLLLSSGSPSLCKFAPESHRGGEKEEGKPCEHLHVRMCVKEKTAPHHHPCVRLRRITVAFVSIPVPTNHPSDTQTSNELHDSVMRHTLVMTSEHTSKCHQMQGTVAS